MLVGISRTLQAFLLRRIPEPGNDWIEILQLHSDGPTSLPANRLVLFLYSVGEEGHMRNRQLVRDGEGFRRPPLAARLRYLVTYVSDDAEEVQRRLTRVLRAFHSTPRLGPAELRPDLVDRVDHLTVRLKDPSPEEMNQLWTALNRGMRLALYYDVVAALVEPEDETFAHPVEERHVVYTESPS